MFFRPLFADDYRAADAVRVSWRPWYPSCDGRRTRVWRPPHINHKPCFVCTDIHNVELKQVKSLCPKWLYVLLHICKAGHKPTCGLCPACCGGVEKLRKSFVLPASVPCVSGGISPSRSVYIFRMKSRACSSFTLLAFRISGRRPQFLRKVFTSSLKRAG